MISWPSTMPKPLQSGFSMQPEDRRIASSTVGTSFQRGFGGDVCIAEEAVELCRQLEEKAGVEAGEQLDHAFRQKLRAPADVNGELIRSVETVDG